MKHKILVCGASGAGKSTSLRNLSPESTIIINTERKNLPFRNAKAFTKMAACADYVTYLKLIAKAASVADCDVIVIDSFTSLSEQVGLYCRQQWSGFAIWNNYQSILFDVVQHIKGIDKHVIITGIDEPLQDDTGVTTRHLRVDGKALKGAIEKEFAMVLWSKVIKEGSDIRYVFETNNDGSTTAKTPMEMFNNRFIDNDIAAVLKAANEYYL